jgi:hypothetical protein
LAAPDFSSLPLAELAERAAVVAERLLTLALAEKQGRELVHAAAEGHRVQQMDAAVKEQVEAASRGEPPRLPAWFIPWLAT